MTTKAAPRRGELPYSAAAEQALIACVLLDEQIAWDEGVAEIVSVDDFFLTEHRAIWRALLSLRGLMPVTWTTTVTALTVLGLIDEVDRAVGPPWTEPYLVSITGEHWAATGCSAYARIIKDYSERRRLVQEAQAMVRDAYDQRKPINQRPASGGYE